MPNKSLQQNLCLRLCFRHKIFLILDKLKLSKVKFCKITQLEGLEQILVALLKMHVLSNKPHLFHVMGIRAFALAVRPLEQV